MKTYWANDGQPNEEGDFEARIDLENGKPHQVFKGKTEKEVADKLLTAQAHSSQRIEELRTARQPDKARPGIEVNRKPLSADERFKLAQDIQNPDTAPEAIANAVEAAVGIPLASISERFNQDEQERKEKEIAEECIAFAQATPEFYQCKYNAELIVNWLELKKMDITRNNCAIAFEALKTAGLVVERPAAPAEPNPQAAGGLPETPNATTRPRGTVVSATGIRNGDSGSSQSRQTAPPQKYTLEDIEKMPAAVYSAKLRGEPGFAKLVDDLAEKQLQANKK